MINIIGTIILVASLSSWTRAQTNVDNAFQRLAKVEYCAVGPVGYAAKVSAGELDARILLSQPKAQASTWFQKLYLLGNSEAQCYALAALHQVDQEKFNEIAVSLSKGQVVRIMRGCLESTETLDKVVTMIAHDEFVFRNLG